MLADRAAPSASMYSLGLWALGSIPGPKAATVGMPAVN